MCRKTTAILIFFLMIHISGSYAQKRADEVMAGTDGYFEQGLAGRVTMPGRRQIGNQHYPSEEWLKGDVAFSTGVEVKGNLLRYNGYMDELFWLYEGDYQQILLDKYMIAEFFLYPLWAGRKLHFRRIGIHAPLLIGKYEIFAEVLYDGNVELYVYRRIIETGRGDYRVGDKLVGGMNIKPAHLYIFRMPDNTVRIAQRLRRSDILNLFPEYRIEFRRLLRENRIRPRNEEELVEAATLLEELIDKSHP